MNLLIAALSVFAGGLVSFALCIRLRDRVNILRNFMVSLNILENAVCYLAIPIARAMRKVDNDLNSFYCDLANKIDSCGASNMPEIWMELLNTQLKVLSKRDKELMLEFATMLGQTDGSMQKNLFSTTIKLIELQIQEAERDMVKNGKLYKVLGFAAGACIAIMII